MSKRLDIFISMITIFVVIFLTIIVVTTINHVNHTIEQNGFEKLETANKKIAKDIYESFDSDRHILQAMANLLSLLHNPSLEEIDNVISAYNFDVSFITYTSLLFPSGEMIYQDGSIRDVSGNINFNDESKLGIYISNLIESEINNELIIRHAIPVIKQNEVVYILYGNIRLSEFENKFKIDIYNGNAYVFIEDGNTADFLLDTYHDYLGNLKDFEDRETSKGYSWESLAKDLQMGQSGRFSFKSESTGRIQYLKYDPIGINNWNIMVMVLKQVVMDEYDDISSQLYLMGALVGIMMMLYTTLLTWYLIRAYKIVKKLSNEDQNTGLLNRNAYEMLITETQNKQYDKVICIFIDVNGLHDINNKYGHKMGDQLLKKVASTLLDEFLFNEVYRIGGDEFVVISENKDLDSIKNKMHAIAKKLEQKNYSISYGIAYKENEIGLSHILHEADDKMLKNKKIYYLKNDKSER